MKLLAELTKMYSERGYEGKNLEIAVFKHALILAVYTGKMDAANYFLKRIKNLSK